MQFSILRLYGPLVLCFSSEDTGTYEPAYSASSVGCTIGEGEPGSWFRLLDVLRRDPVLRTKWFSAGSRWDGTGSAGSDWFVPAVLEQYKFYTPISESNAMMIQAYLAAYQRTASAIFHAKAVSLANAIIQAQIHHGGGEIPTHLRKAAIDDDFIKCGVYSALTLLENADVLAGDSDKDCGFFQ